MKNPDTRTNHLAFSPRRTALAPAEGVGRVLMVVDTRGFQVMTRRGSCSAERAPSCLLVPQPGDEVALVTASDGAFVITSILRRSSADGARLELPGQHTEVVSAGDLCIQGQKGLEIHSPVEVRIRGAKLNIATLKTRLASEAVELLATRIDAGLTTARVVARKFDAAVGTLAVRLERSFRWVDELDQVRAGQLDWRAEGNARLQGKNAIIDADLLVQIRGEEVHLS